MPVPLRGTEPLLFSGMRARNGTVKKESCSIYGTKLAILKKIDEGVPTANLAG